jgi:Methylase involved in ubiquinone/menaquinone biosynthesis
MNKENGTYNKHLQKYSRIVQDGNDDLVLQFTTEVLGLESLHWGYWDDNDQLNLENLKKAQKNFTSHLSSFIPEGVSQILDVGCGIGDNALHLSENGYKLTCISPDIIIKKHSRN